MRIRAGSSEVCAADLSVGRHPLAGIAAALAAVSGGYAGNIMPGQLDVLLFGFTQEAARIVEPGWTMNPLGNWYFILGVVVFFTPIIWFVTDRIVEPRLGVWNATIDDESRADLEKGALSDAERRGLRPAGIAALLGTEVFAARASVVKGTSVRVPVDLGGSRNSKKKKQI